MTKQRRPRRSVAESRGSARSRQRRCLCRRSTKVACPGEVNEAKVRIRRDESLALRWRSQGVVFRPDEKRRHRQRAPALTEDQLASVPRAAPIGDTGNQAEHALDVSSAVRDVEVEQPVVDLPGVLDEDLAPELAARVPRRVREQVPAEPPADEGSPSGSIMRGGLRVTPNGAPTSTRRDTRPGASSAKATDKGAPSELATTSTVGSSSPSTTSRRNVRPWSSRSTPR